MVKVSPVDSGRETGAVAEHIARAAARLFAARGYDATPVRAIVEAAGVTKPTLYYHFGSKEGLAQALLTRPLTRLLAGHRAILDGPADPAQKLADMMEAEFAFVREDPDRARFVYALFFGPLGSSLSAELAQFGGSLKDLLAEAVQAAAAAGVVDPDRAFAFHLALKGVGTVHTMGFLYGGCELDPALAHQLVADLLRGFGRHERLEVPVQPHSKKLRARTRTRT
ncbi:MAG TPA: TetR/AcrR family transcriptional regulator [Isosphaeraceae bacterium]|nr:TetR/AcrR family transcriptional regulator [Isosphaeraceae bacterium]